MIGLYLLTTAQLEKDKTIKFGMSMRIEYRWIDYLIIFNDSKYVYYYEFLDNLTRKEILDIEDEILQLHKNERNYFFQNEYFYCEDNIKFHQTIIDILNNKNIKYTVHNNHNFNREYYDYKPEPFIFQKQIENNIIKPHDYQLEILDKIKDFYENNDVGKIIHSCGLGKTLLGLFIVQKLRCKIVIIGVPSIYLQRQMKNEIMRIFNNHKNILYVGGETENNENYIIQSTTNKKKIKKFINNKSADCKFIITTYDSCYRLLNYKFDFKIGDEAHHLVGIESEKTKESFHKIESKKSLFMTATEKIIENNKTNKVIYSMDDENIFGKLIDSKSVNWAIKNKKITDYNLIILKNTESEINNIINELNLNNEGLNKDLFLSAFMSLKSIEKYNDLTHILIYTNKTENAELVKKYIDIILKLNIINVSKENYYNKALHSKSDEKLNDIRLFDGTIKEGEITKFKKALWGIISSVYIFGEGFDCRSLNGVVFGENMESDIRIVQSTLRPNRLDSNFPNKKAYIIIPYIDTQNFMTDSNSFDKCRKIIAKIRNVDETIEQKINVVSLNKYNVVNEEKKIINHYHIIEDGNELSKIILRLRYSKSLGTLCTEEEDEYNYIKELNKQLKIQSKEDYIKDYVKEYYEKYIKYIENPEEYFKGIWKSWYDFIGVDTNKFIQNKYDWIIFCKEKNIKSLDDYTKLCKLYDFLPVNPANFYKEFTTIPIELELYIKRRK
jgi:predicted helicase